ncbi:MAG: ABC transporter ATP-binding protein [Dehalococcoidales bacterium]|nr:ABC transporter ATP-binding protein [Dehalococcoidales bacterium]
MAFGGWGGGGGGGPMGMGGGRGGGALRRAVDGWSDDVLGKAYDHKVVVRLIKYIRPYRLRVIIAIIGTVIFSATSYTQPVLIGMATDYALSGSMPDLVRASLGLVALALLAWASYYGYMSSTAWMGHSILLTLRQEMFTHLQKLSMSFYDNNEVGRVMSRIQNDVTSLQELLTSGFFTVLADFLGLAVIIFWLFRLDWVLAFGTIAVLPLLILVLWIWQERAKKAFIKVRQAIAVVNSNLQENISGVRVIQSLNRETENQRRFDSVNTDNLNANVDAARLTAIVNPAVELSVAIAMAAVIILGGIRVMNDVTTVGVIVSFALYVQRFFEPVRELVMQYAQLQRAMAGGQRAFEVLDTPPEIVDRPGAEPLPPVKGEVILQNVNFSYIPEIPVLKNINLHVLPGQTVALVGQTGSGKTTITALIARLYDVTSGSIRIDGYDVRDVQRTSIARQMGVVLQDPFLFSGTVRDNLKYGRPEATDEEMIRGAEAVGAHDFIMRLENGYDTVLDERGQNLSLGQRQLLSFARAIIADPKILILDEATAKVDSTTEVAIQRALNELLHDRTSFIIAHRLSTIRSADRIIVLKDGVIVEEGKHDELVAQNGVYSGLYRMTFESDRSGNNGAKPETKSC